MFTSPILSKFNENSLAVISKARGIKLDRRRPTKQAYLDVLTNNITVEGIKQFTSLLPVKDLQSLTANMDEETLSSNGVNNMKSRAVMSKRLAEALHEYGVMGFFSNLKPKVDVLAGVVKRLGMEPVSEKRDELILQIHTEIHIMGLSSVLSNFPAKQLQQFAKDLGLSVESSAKMTLLRCVVSLSDYKPAPRPVASGRKPRSKPQGKENQTGNSKAGTGKGKKVGKPAQAMDWYFSDDSENDEEFETKPSPEDEDVEMSDAEEREEDLEEYEKDDEKDKEDYKVDKKDTTMAEKEDEELADAEAEDPDAEEEPEVEQDEAEEDE